MQEGLHGQKNREEKTCLPQQLYALGGGIDAAGATECWEAHMQRHGDGAAQQVVFSQVTPVWATRAEVQTLSRY